MTSEAGTRFGDYELLEEVGRGGMGVVYRARQASLDRVVAVKMILTGSFASPVAVRRFRAEAATAAALRHPNIISIHDIGDHEGRVFFSMDFLEGQPLGKLARDQPFSPRQAARLMQTTADAVHYAHRRGVLHRDLKPSNIMVDEFEQPHLMDFGLAKPMTGDTELTLTGQVLGSPCYMAPEQADGGRDPLSPQSDIYALGAVLYFLLTGRPPFQGGSVREILRHVHDSDPVPPARLNPSVPPDLQTVCLKCLEKDPRKRYSSADALARDLQCFLQDKPIEARAVSRLEKGWRWCRRNPVPALLSLSLLMAMALGMTGMIWQWRRAEINARNSLEGLVRLHVANGTRMMEEDNPLLALPWLAEGLRLAAPHPRAGLDHRLRLASALGSAPALVQVWALERMAVLARFTPDASTVIVAEGILRLEDHVPLAFHIYDMKSGMESVRIQVPPNLATWTLSPDGSLLAVCPSNAPVQVWDMGSGKPAPPLEPPADSARVARFRAGNHRLLLAVEDSVRTWNPATGRLEGPALNHGAGILRAEYSLDGRRIATLGEDHAIVVWDAEKGTPVGPRIQQPSAIVAMILDASGDRVLVSDRDSAVRLWEATTGRGIGEFRDAGDLFRYLAFSPDLKHAAASGVRGTLWVGEPESGTPAFPPLHHIQPLRDMDFSPDGRWLAVCGGDGYARIYRADTGGSAVPPLPHDSMVVCLEFSPDGRRLLTGTSQGLVRVWDLAGRAFPKVLPESIPRSHPVYIHPNGGELVSVNSTRTERWRLEPSGSLGPPVVTAHDSEILSIAFHETNNAYLAVAMQTAQWVDADQGITGPLIPFDAINSFSARITVDPRIIVLISHPDPGRSAAQDGGEGAQDLRVKARLFDAVTGRPVAPLCVLPKPPMDVSSDGRWAVVAGRQATAEVWDLTRGELGWPILPHPNGLRQARFSPDGSRLATVSPDGPGRTNVPRIWTGPGPGPISPPVFLQEATRIASILFSPDGRRLAASSQESGARIWDPITGRPITPTMRQGQPGNHLSFSPDSRFLITMTFDGTFRVWNVETGEPLTLPTRGQRLASVSFSGDGQTLIGRRVVGPPDLWEFRPATDPVLELTPQAQLLSSHRLENGASLEAIPAPAFADLWAAVRSTGAAMQAVPPERARAWHERQFEDSRQSGQAFAAEFHLAQIRRQPRDTNLRGPGHAAIESPSDRTTDPTRNPPAHPTSGPPAQTNGRP